MNRLGKVKKLGGVNLPKNQVQRQTRQQKLQCGFELVFESGQRGRDWVIGYLVIAVLNQLFCQP